MMTENTHKLWKSIELLWIIMGILLLFGGFVYVAASVWRLRVNA